MQDRVEVLWSDCNKLQFFNDKQYYHRDKNPNHVDGGEAIVLENSILYGSEAK
jgi:hypothetical protein